MKTSKYLVTVLGLSMSAFALTACGGGGGVGGGGGGHVSAGGGGGGGGTTTIVYVSDPSTIETGTDTLYPSYPSTTTDDSGSYNSGSDPNYGSTSGSSSSSGSYDNSGSSSSSSGSYDNSGGYDSGSSSSGGYDAGNDDSYDNGGGYDDGGYDGGYDSSGGSSDGCDASGCNSFGSGGSKNTGLLATKVTKAQIATKAASVASQFQMSVPAATKLVQLSVQVKGMRQQRQLTQADRDAIAASAFKVAGVTTNQVNSAIKASLASGNQKAIEDVMNTAAQNLGMPSGATFRDKIMPLFEGK